MKLCHLPVFSQCAVHGRLCGACTCPPVRLLKVLCERSLPWHVGDVFGRGGGAHFYFGCVCISRPAAAADAPPAPGGVLPEELVLEEAAHHYDYNPVEHGTLDWDWDDDEFAVESAMLAALDSFDFVL